LLNFDKKEKAKTKIPKDLKESHLSGLEEIEKIYFAKREKAKKKK